MTTTCALYARISVSDAKTPKVEIQLADLRKLAAQRGYEVVAEYADDGLSAAKAENRPDFDRMLSDLARSKFQMILATEEARLARNNSEKNALLLTCVQVGARWETIRDGAVDPATAAGSFMAVVRGAVDSLESARKSERQKSANAARRASGRPVPGQRPFGWDRDQLTPVPAEQALIRQGIDLILSGQKPWSVVKAWNASGVKTGRGNDWSSTSVISVLKRWRNAGLTEHKGEPITQAQWQPICTRQELEDVRAILCSPKDRPGWRTPAALCSGTARCVCGQTMVKTGNAWGYSYRCSTIQRPGAKMGTHTQIKCETLDELVRAQVVMSYFIDPGQTTTNDDEAQSLAALYATLSDVRESLARLDRDYYRPGSRMTEARHASIETELLAQQHAATQEIESRARRSAHAAMLSEQRRALLAGELGDKAKPVFEDLYERFDSLDLDGKRQLIAGTVSIVVKPGRGTDRVEFSTLTDPTDQSVFALESSP